MFQHSLAYSVTRSYHRLVLQIDVRRNVPDDLDAIKTYDGNVLTARLALFLTITDADLSAARLSHRLHIAECDSFIDAVGRFHRPHFTHFTHFNKSPVTGAFACNAMPSSHESSIDLACYHSDHRNSFSVQHVACRAMCSPRLSYLPFLAEVVNAAARCAARS